MASCIADAILVVHFAFIAFVVLGEACVVVGHFRNWNWARNLTFRVCHLLAIGIVVAQAWANQICPLTAWESEFRIAAGEQSYSVTFIEYWLGRLVYYDAPQWMFTGAYMIFGFFVIFSWVWVKPKRGVPKKEAGGDA